jgi:YD repeat-containing protein
MVLTYNQNNRLIRVEEDSVILVEYTYNGLGQRIIKEADGATTIFHYDFDGNIIGESDTSGNFSKEYPYRGTSRLALVDVSTGEIYYYGNDQLGTPQIL